MPDNPTTGLVKAAQSPALARVSNQLALTDKLLTKPEEPFLIPYRKGNKWGFCDRNKNIVIDCIYDEAKPFGTSLTEITSNDEEYTVDPFGRRAYMCEEANSFFEKLAGVKLNGKYGFVNRLGIEVIPPIYDSNDYFYNGLATVKINGKYGYVNRKGQEVIEVKYDYARNFRNTLAEVGLNGKRGFIDISGKEIVDIIYEYVDAFYYLHCDTIRVKLNGKYGLISSYGKQILTAIYDKIDYAREGIFRIKIGEKCGFVSAEGREITEIKYQFDEPDLYCPDDYFSEGFFIIKDDNKYGFLNALTEEIIEIKYDLVKSFSEGLALVSIKDKYGFINQLGEETISLTYDIADSFSEGLAIVGLANTNAINVIQYNDGDEFSFSDDLVKMYPYGYVGFVNQSGHRVLPLMYDAAGSFMHGKAEVKQNGKRFSISQTGKVVKDQTDFYSHSEESETEYIENLVDNFISEHNYGYADEHDDDFDEDLLRIRVADEWCYVDRSGKKILILSYEEADTFSEGLAKVGLDSRYGFVNRAGEEVIPVKYDNASEFSGGFAEVSLNGQEGILLKSGKDIIPLKYERVDSFKNGLAYVKVKSKGGYIDQEGKEYWED